jgi:hypothetical protein
MLSCVLVEFWSLRTSIYPLPGWAPLTVVILESFLKSSYIFDLPWGRSARVNATSLFVEHVDEVFLSSSRGLLMTVDEEGPRWSIDA